MAKYEIHISDVRTFKQCRRKWEWSSMLRRGLESTKPYAPFFTGRAIHHCLEHYYAHHVTFDKALEIFLATEKEKMEATGALWPVESEIFDQQIDLIRGLLDHYRLWLGYDAGRWADDQLDFISMETSFSVPIHAPSGRPSSKVFFAGRFDGLVRRKDDGSYWIWETKTTRSIDELKRSLDNDEQAGGYILAAQELFKVPISGVLYNIIRKKLPTTPRLLQSGTLSLNKQIDTTAYHYMDTIKEVHPDWTMPEIMAEYGAFLDYLLLEGRPFFARVPIYRTQSELATLAHDLHLVALEMTRPNVAIYPTPSWMNCNFCHFRAPCLALNAGADYEFLLREEFQPRSQWETLEVDDAPIANGETPA